MEVVSSKKSTRKTGSNAVASSKSRKSKAPSSALAERMAQYQQNANQIVDESKVKAIKKERKSHVVKQTKTAKKKSTDVIKQAVEDKKARTFDSLMDRLGVPQDSSGEGEGNDAVTSPSSTPAAKAVSVETDSNVLSMNNSQAFERIDRRKHDAKALAKLHQQYETFVKHVATLEHIDTIEMANCELTDKFAELVAEHWIGRKDCKLVSLNLETNLFQEDGVIALAKAAAKNKSITSYFLRHQNGRGTVSTPAAEAWCEAMANNTTVLRLGLDTALSQHRDALQNYVKRNTDQSRKERRQNLKKQGVAIQQADSAERRRIRAVAANESGATGDPKESVFRLPDSEKLPFKVLKSAEKAELGSAFASNTIFETVDLQSLELDDAFGLALAESLRTNTTLTSIDLSSNRLTSKSLDVIAKVLRDENRTLKEFKVLNQTPNTGIVRATETLLKEAVEQNPVITKLSLSKWTDSFARDQVDKKLMKNKWSKKK